MNNTLATLHNPQSGEVLAQISLGEENILVDEVISTSGNLMGFTFLSKNGKIKQAWYHKKAVLLRAGETQQLVNIATYPTLGENQGHLVIIEGTIERYDEKVQLESQSKPQKRRWLTLLQILLGT